MSLWSCSWEDCKEPAVQRAGDCLICDRHLCRTHLQQPWHTCATSDDDWDTYCIQYPAAEKRYLEQLCQRIDAVNLCSRASGLRNNIACTVSLSPTHLSSMMGGQNCHATITFADNIEWLARFRLTWTLSPPQQVRDYILRSEAATLTFLHRCTKVPVPEIYDWACESDANNTVGVGYILMQKLAGKSLDWSSANHDEKEKVMKQLVDINLELENYPFGAMGSLVVSDDDASGFEVRGLATSSTFRAGKGALGPFSSSRQGWREFLQCHIEAMRRGEIQASRLVDLYTAHIYRLDLVDALFPTAPTGKFFLKHPDDKGDHIFVSETFDIIGIIDWEWTHTVSKAEAFNSPCMMWPVAEFYDGSNQLAEEETRFAELFGQSGNGELAACVREGRGLQRFSFALGAGASFEDAGGLMKLLGGLRDGLGSESEWEGCKRRVLEGLETDESLVLLREMYER